MNDKFIIDIDKLRQEQISVLRVMKKEGEKHMEYFNRTAIHFKYPERRIKTYDTVYYEQLLPIINKILGEWETKNN